MSLESEMLKVVQGAVKRSNKTSGYDTPATVTRIEDDVAWVHIDGGVDETPVRKTIDAKEGDTVQVRVAGGKAWLTGNASRPPTDDATANYAINIAGETNVKVTEVENYVVNEITAQKAVIGDLESDTAKIHNLTADQLTATVGYISDLTAGDVTASNIIADHAALDTLDVSTMSAAAAYIRDLEAENITAQDIAADHATIDTLDSTYATISELHSDYAEIDLANVNNAWIQNGVVKDAAISDAQIIGISANKLTAGTIDASNITVTNLNADNITTGTINGQRIGSESITLDKLAEEVPTKAYLDNVAQNLQGQIDGQIETWTGTVVPTLNNSPASSWSTADERHKHVGDIYYVVNAGATADGYTYRFTESGTTTKTYSWTLIKDNQITKALQDIIDIQSDISDIESFDSQISSWKTDTDEELGSLKSRTSTLETGMGNKVDTSTFNEVKQTVDENSASITSLTTTVNSKADSSTVTTLSNTVNSVSQKADANESAISNLTETVDSKADGSTVSTLSQTVNSVQQTANSNSSTISQLTTTLGTNADGTTKAGDLVHKVSDIDQDLDSITTRVGKTEVQIKGSYATSSTGASTQSKTATITPTVTGWELYTGATVTVKFTAKNTATTPALNVNGTGAKTIKGFNGSALTEAEYKWAANDTITFIYNGTYWLMQNSSTQATRLSNAETELSQNATLIQSKASQTDLNTLTGRVSTAESTITQQATAIEAKVSKDGVIASINASVEKEGGSAVTINADKVNIAGATIFTTGRLSETSLNDTYAGVDDVPTKVSDLTNDSGFQTASDVSRAVSNGVSGKADKTDAIAEEQRIYYRCKVSGKPSGNALPTTWITNESNIWNDTSTVTAANAWSRKVTPISTGTSDTNKYLYLWTCVQKKTVSGAVSYSPILYDDSTTIIDGGTIITGTIHANRIGAGDISADRMKANSITAINSLTTGKINADRLDVANITVGSLKDGSSYSTTSQVNTAISTAVSNVQVGGRNLLLNSKLFKSVSSSGITSEASSLGEEYVHLYGTATATVDLALADLRYITLTGATVTISANSVFSGSDNYLYVTTAKNNAYYKTYRPIKWYSNTKRYITINLEDGETLRYIGAHVVNGTQPSIHFRFKVEVGNRQTDWTPAPEDVAATATNYITHIDNNGIRVHPASTENNSVVINANGMEVFKGGTSVAMYGDESRVGNADSYHTKMTDSSIELRNADNTMFSVMATGETVNVTNTRLLLRASTATTGTSRTTSVILDPGVSYQFTMYSSPAREIQYSFTTSSASTTSQTVTSSDSTRTMTIAFAKQTRTVSGTTQIAHVKATITETRTSTSTAFPAVGYSYTKDLDESSVHFFGNNNVLWQGAWYMNEQQTATLSESVSAQLSGIVLVWSYFASNTAYDYDWHYTYVPKAHVLSHGGTGIDCGIWTVGGNFATVAAKYVYVSNAEVTGYASNSTAGTGSSGIKFDNTKYVLRYVLGV